MFAVTASREGINRTWMVTDVAQLGVELTSYGWTISAVKAAW